MSPRPTQLVRGYNGSTTSVTNFVYDDFGRLVEAVVPEAGVPGSPAPTRYEYDVAGRMVKKRVGAGTSAVRTSLYSYDSLGRTTYVDHDVEHPVDCTTAAAGTPIQDEEYRYDTCSVPDAPSGFTCSNATGRLTISRAILQCGSGGQVVKRGRWYAYNSQGAVSAIAHATVTGTGVGPAATQSVSHTLGGRLKRWTSPLNSAYGTRYDFDYESMRPIYVATSDFPGLRIADNITYRAFGPMDGMTAGLSQTAGSSTRTLKMINDYEWHFDYRLNTLRWHLAHSSGPWVSSIALMNQLMSYTSGGLLRSRHDTLEPLASRYYEYDALLRLTCEARGGFGVSYASAADCNTTSLRVAGLFSYNNGEGAGSPPDVRKTAFIKSENTSQTPCSTANSCYLSPSVESSTYSSGSGQLQGVTRTGSSLVLGHDTLGRRTFDYDSVDPVRSRRNYTYLPNGQLGTISGRTAQNHPYSYAVRYDERRRPVTISSRVEVMLTGDDSELFWDDQDRLIALHIVPPYWRDSNSNPIKFIRWHYHYLGSMLIGATRELVRLHNTDVKRFWALTDERGLVHRLLDEQGATYWQARWEATGWRTYVGLPEPEMFVPFGLPGQIVLGAWRTYGSFQPGKRAPVWQHGTDASADAAGISWSRPPIALNHERAYDPLLGAFTSPDGLDQQARLMPEGYVYGRGDPVAFYDADGQSADSWSYSPARFSYFIDDSCQFRQGYLSASIVGGIQDLQECTRSYCAQSFLRRQAIYALTVGAYYCAQQRRLSFPVPPYGNSFGLDRDLRVREYKADGTPESLQTPFFARNYNRPPQFMHERKVILGGTTYGLGSCWKALLVHEALHSAIKATPNFESSPVNEFDFSHIALPLGRTNIGTGYDEEAIISDIVSQCVNCIGWP